MTYYLYIKTGKKEKPYELIADSGTKRLIEMTRDAHIDRMGKKPNQTNRAKYRITEKRLL
jgi:hypothetical protein